MRRRKASAAKASPDFRRITRIQADGSEHGQLLQVSIAAVSPACSILRPDIKIQRILAAIPVRDMAGLEVQQASRRRCSAPSRA